MALATSTVWELRVEGDATNGGGFYDRDPGTSVDYSQQDAAELSLTDLACVAASTTLTSVTGGFTAAMAGNVIYIASGTNELVGWYEITAYTDTNTVTIDRTCASGGDMSATSGKVGGAWTTNGSNEDAFFTVATDDEMCIYIAAGTYTFSEAVVTASQTGQYCSFIGYGSVRGDDPTGTDRPLFALGAHSLSVLTDATIYKNIQFTASNASEVVKMDTFTWMYNCSVINSGAGEGVDGGSYGGLVGCYVEIAGNAEAVVGGTECVIGCHIVNSNGSATGQGVDGRTSVYNSIIENFNDGVYQAVLVSNCIIYKCNRAVVMNGMYSSMVTNSIIHTCTTFVYGSAEADYTSFIGLNNCLHDVTNPTDSLVAQVVVNDYITADPGFAAPATGNFSITSTSPAYRAGFNIMDYISGITI